jgi:hypothetical protein
MEPWYLYYTWTGRCEVTDVRRVSVELDYVLNITNMSTKGLLNNPLEHRYNTSINHQRSHFLIVYCVHNRTAFVHESSFIPLGHVLNSLTPWPRQLEEELILACSSRGYSFIMAQEHCKNWQLWWQKQEAKNACLPPQASSREWAGSGADNKRLPHDMLSPKRHYLTKVPKQCCQMGTKPSNTGAYKGHFSFKPPMVMKNG